MTKIKLGTLIRIDKANQAEEAFQKLRSLGFSACQIVYKPAEYKNDDALLIKNAAEKYGIDICARYRKCKKNN